MRVLGIDPGSSGAVALLESRPDGPPLLIAAEEVPFLTIRKGKRNTTVINPGALATTIREWQIDAAWMELVGAMPKQGVASMFAFGRSVGQVEGILATLGVTVSYIAPPVWKLAIGIKAGSTKDASRAKASQLWPGKAGLFARAKDDGRAEAALIAAAGLKAFG